MSRLYSFVLPAYKARFLKEAIDSILAQTYTNFELIIVNDASPENIESIVNSYNDSRIKYYRNGSNIGSKNLVAQWNTAISYANGEYLILASDDDVYHISYLEKMDVLVDKYPNVNIFRPRIQNIDAFGNIIKICGIVKEYVSTFEFLYYLDVVGRGVPFYVFKSVTLRSIGGFVNYPLAWHSDDATIIAMSTNGIVFTDEVLFSFRLSGESISTKKNTVQVFRDKLYATISYYKDLPKILNSSERRNSEDDWYYDSILKNIPSLMRNDIRYDFELSSKWAVIKALPNMLKSKVYGIKVMLRMYCQHLFLR